MKKKPTVTVGIPAYNEERNIAHLLRTLLRQKQSSFTLKEIIVISDASTDGTVAKVKKVRSRKINLVENNNRVGQCQLQNRICSLSNSDILVILEADTLPRNSSYLEELVRALTANNNEIVFGFPHTVKAKTIFGEALVFQSRTFQKHHKYNVKAADMLSTGQGGKAITKKTYKTINWPDNISEDYYLLLWAKKNNLKYDISLNAINRFRCPESVGDYIKKKEKVILCNTELSNYFSQSEITNTKKTTSSNKISMLMQFAINSPLLLAIYLPVAIYTDALLHRTNTAKQYRIALSTKTIIN